MISPVKIWRRQKELKKIIGKRGRILTWTKIFVAGTDFKKMAPYYVVLVEFDDKSHGIGQLVDIVDEKINTKSQVIALLRKVKDIREEDVIPYGIKFRLI